MPTIRPPRPSDWETFYTLAEAEGWKVSQVERKLFSGAWSKYVQVLAEGDFFCGLMTAVPHQRSGWIGNLIIPPDLRGLGYGSRLFKSGLAELQKQRLSSIWLTASEQGRPLYEKAGFVVVDQIERWVFPARKDSPAAKEESGVPWETLVSADQSAWGENRDDFLKRLSSQSRLFVCDDAVAALQTESDLQIIGPWYCREPSLHSNSLLLEKLISASDPSREITIDLIASTPLRSLFAAAGFVRAGEAELMASGDIRLVNLTTMVSLASLGSVG